MEGLAEVAFHRSLVSAHRLKHLLRGRARGCQESLDEPAGLFRVQDDALLVFQRGQGGLSRLADYEMAKRLAVHRSRTGDHSFVFSRNSRHKAVAFPSLRGFYQGRHVHNVCTMCAQSNSKVAAF